MKVAGNRWGGSRNLNNPWGFRLTANNLLDNRTKVSNSLSDFLVSEQMAHIMPRVLCLCGTNCYAGALPYIQYPVPLTV